MPIPAEILAVERPKNTVVVCYGKNKDRYAVRQRIGCKRVNGSNRPVTGPTIGHIVKLKYEPINKSEPTSLSSSPIDLKDWANIALCDKLFKSILDYELLKVFHSNDAQIIYAISILRVCYPGIKDCELKEAYDTSFLSEFYPDVPLSKNSVSTFLNELGKRPSRIIQFMRNRTSNISIDHHLLIDGTLKSNESDVNSFSDFSYKAKTKGTRDISVLYAYDFELEEPICSKCFPGNMLDLTSFETFISENGITKGFIVADKGFPSNSAWKYFSQNPDLHYLNPIKRNSKLIKQNLMLEMNDQLEGYAGITYKKAKVFNKNKWLYSFRDSAKAAKEEMDWLAITKRNGKYSHQLLLQKQKTFGVIVLESDCDLTPVEAYKAYMCRWKIEVVMKFYKSVCEFDETRVHDDYSVIASEFCDFLSTLLTFKLLKIFKQTKLTENYPYKKIMKVLEKAKRIRWQNNEWKFVKINPSYEEILKVFGIIEPPPKEPAKKRGRPKKVAI